MRKQRISIRFASCCIVALWTTSTATYADFNLDKLKAIADRVQATQERMKQQGSKDLPAESNEGAATQAGHDSSNSPSGVDDVTTKAAREKWDVAGVKMGMSLGEALKQLNVHNPRLRIVDKRTQKFADADNIDHPYLVVLVEGEKSRPIESVYIKASMPPRQHVLYVQRHKQYTNSDAPTMKAAFTALSAKYGNQPEKGWMDQTNYGNRHLLWQEGGRPGGNIVCRPSAPLAPLTIRPVKGCELIMISANVQPLQGNPDVADSLTTTLTDLAMIRHDVEDTEHYLENARKNRKKKELENATKKPPPKL